MSFPGAVVAALEARLEPEADVRVDGPAAAAEGEGALARALRTADRASKRLLLIAAGHAAATAQDEDEADCDRELVRAFGA